MAGLPSVKLSGNGTSAVILINAPPFFPPAPMPLWTWALGLACTLSSGANLTYTVQVTCDQVPSEAGNWNAHDILVNQTASANGNVAFPITGLRLVVTNYVTGSVNLGVCVWP